MAAAPNNGPSPILFNLRDSATALAVQLMKRPGLCHAGHEGYGTHCIAWLQYDMDQCSVWIRLVQQAWVWRDLHFGKGNDGCLVPEISEIDGLFSSSL